MKVKIDTKEKFHVINLKERVVSANMTAELDAVLLLYLQKDIKNVVLKMEDVKEIDEIAAMRLVSIQQEYYDSNASFVICEVDHDVEQFLDNKELLEMMNIVPTESEAWDIVQLEEIEREMMEE
jgi:anti-anti-sigma factor